MYLIINMSIVKKIIKEIKDIKEETRHEKTNYSLYEKQGLSKEEIDKLLVLDIKKHDYFTKRSMWNEHGGGGLFDYDSDVMGWLFDK